ncbi:MAG: hypothetical protein DMF94_22420 [Acidobacteria bacterium]|nr:MAG: hypothetical protein DMF94_22420 [Acidobacteriota bacterium]
MAVALASIFAAGRSVAQAPAPAQSNAGFAPIASLVEAAIARHELPGAVVLIGRGDAIAFSAVMVAPLIG